MERGGTPHGDLSDFPLLQYFLLLHTRCPALRFCWWKPSGAVGPWVPATVPRTSTSGGALRPTAGLRSLSGPCLFPLLPQASRAQILDKATEYIQYMRRKNHTHQQDIDDLKRQNALLEQQGELPPLPPPPGRGYKGRAPPHPGL